MEFKMDSKIVEAAAKAPRMFVDASLGEGEEYNRETGIQLTKEQIISLRKYEVLGLSLPVRIEDVRSYLNYGAGDVGGGWSQGGGLSTDIYPHLRPCETLVPAA